MPRERVEPGPLVVLNNALAGSLLLVTDCRLDGRIRNRQTLTSNLNSDLRIYGPKTFSWSLEPSRGPGSEGYIPPSDSRHIKASVCNQNQCQGLTSDLFDAPH